MIEKQKAEKILTELDKQLTLAVSKNKTERIQLTMQLLHEHQPHYHWVGVYYLQNDTLVLGPYVGPETDHVQIPVGRGVCGTAVAENKNQIVDDVRLSSNYLACNLETRSEIVVLIREPGTSRILGQIDVDGTAVAGFDHSDELFLEQVAKRLSRYCQ